MIQDNKSGTIATINDQVLFADARNMTVGDVAPSQQEAYAHTNNAGGLVLQAYGISSKDSNAMKSSNPKSGIYEATTARTLDANGGNPACNQGGMMIVEADNCNWDGSQVAPTLTRRNAAGSQRMPDKENFNCVLTTDGVYGLGRDSFNQGKGAQFAPSISEGVQPPLIAKGSGGVVYPTYCITHASHFTEAEEELAGTLCESDFKDPHRAATPVGFYSQLKAECMTPLKETSPCLVNGTSPGFQNGVVDYIVRRHTPTECARLQGFPDWWCDDLGEDDPDLPFWREIWDNWCDVNGIKHKTDGEIKRWLKNPYSEAEEYKMWGNGVALPCVFFVMAGIAAWNEGKIPEEDEELPLLKWFEEGEE